MGDEFKDKMQKLDNLKIEDEIAEERMKIAQKKAVEADMKKRYGRDWKKILKLVKVDREAMLTMFGPSNELKELSRPRSRLPRA